MKIFGIVLIGMAIFIVAVNFRYIDSVDFNNLSGKYFQGLISNIISAFLFLLSGILVIKKKVRSHKVAIFLLYLLLINTIWQTIIAVMNNIMINDSIREWREKASEPALPNNIPILTGTVTYFIGVFVMLSFVFIATIQYRKLK